MITVSDCPNVIIISENLVVDTSVGKQREVSLSKWAQQRLETAMSLDSIGMVRRPPQLDSHSHISFWKSCPDLLNSLPLCLSYVLTTVVLFTPTGGVNNMPLRCLDWLAIFAPLSLPGCVVCLPYDDTVYSNKGREERESRERERAE